MRKVILLLLLATAYAWEELTCDSGYINCNGECVDKLADINNCDDCGYNCPEGRKCIDGMCKCYTQLITFDDLTAPGVGLGIRIPHEYKGFTWDNINILSLPITYYNGLVSPSNVIHSPNFAVVSTISRSTPFNLVSIYASDSDSADVSPYVATVIFTGYRKGVPVATTTYIADYAVVRLFVFPSEFNNIDKFTFSITTGDLTTDVRFDNLLVCV